MRKSPIYYLNGKFVTEKSLNKLAGFGFVKGIWNIWFYSHLQWKALLA